MPLDDYFLTSLPLIEGCEVVPLIDGLSYFEDLRTELDALTGQEGEGVLIAGWWMEANFELSGGTGALRYLLEEKKRSGVDVRVLVWASDTVLGHEVGLARVVTDIALALGTDMYDDIQTQNLESVRDLRFGLLANSVIVNTLDHPLGSSHVKMVVIFRTGHAVAYTGGLDLQSFRKDAYPHTSHYPDPGWHDVQAKLKGPAVQPMYDAFRDMWNELVTRADSQPASNPAFVVFDTDLGLPNGFEPSLHELRAVPDGAEYLPARMLSGGQVGTQIVQSLRTIPDMASPPLLSLERRLSFAHSPDGDHEIRNALAQAISCAREFIYVEDQGMYSRDLLALLNAAIKQNSALKLVMLIPGVPDPEDPQALLLNDSMRGVMSERLLQGLSAGQLKQILLCQLTGVVVHSKTWIIDDCWALIGSANMTNRSMYVDLEHSVAFGDRAVDSAVKQYRIALWAEHFDITAVTSIELIGDLPIALSFWNPGIWGPAPPAALLPDRIVRLPLPVLADPVGSIFKTFDDPGELP